MSQHDGEWRRMVLGSRAHYVDMLMAEWNARRELLQRLHGDMQTRAKQTSDLTQSLGDQIASAQVHCVAARDEAEDYQRIVQTLETEANALRKKIDNPFKCLWCACAALFGKDGPGTIRQQAETLEHDIAGRLGEQSELLAKAEQAERAYKDVQDPLRDAAFAYNHLAETERSVRRRLDDLVDAIDVEILSSCADKSMDLWRHALARHRPDDVDMTTVLQHRDRLRHAWHCRSSDAVRPPNATPMAIEPLIESGFSDTSVKTVVRAHVKGTGHRHVKRTRSSGNGTSTYWKKSM